MPRRRFLLLPQGRIVAHIARIVLLAGAVVVGSGAGSGTLRPSGWAATVDYLIDDGSSERAIGIDPGEDTIWFNTFPVQAGGEVIDSISAAYGRPGSTSPLNGLPVSILLYEDLDGGSPWNAVLKRSVPATVANGNTNTLNVYPIPPTEIHGTLLAAVLFRNTTTTNRFISALDQTAPTFPDRSYYGFAVGLNENDLSSIPAGQFGTIESLNQVGNWVLRAHGVSIPEPALGIIGCMGVGCWTMSTRFGVRRALPAGLAD
jgi:hypothetical protein